MTPISSNIPVGNKPVTFSLRTKTAVVLIALAALAGLIYYLKRKGSPPSNGISPDKNPSSGQISAPKPAVQKVVESSTNPPSTNPEPSQISAPIPAVQRIIESVKKTLSFRQTPAPNPAVQRIVDSFKNAPSSLDPAELLTLAKNVLSIQSPPNAARRCQTKITSGFFSDRKKRFIIEKKHNAIRVQYIAETLGRGSFGKVVRLVDLHDGAETALKIAIPSKKKKNNQQYRDKAVVELRKEHRNLEIVHNNRDVEPKGVQDKPLSVVLTIVKLYDAHVKSHVAFEGTLYEGNLDRMEPWNLEIKVRLNVALQVLEGMETLIANKLICHDLKVPNILYRGNQVHVADLGGATLESELKQEMEKGGLAHTPGYADIDRLVRAQDASKRYVRKKLVRDSEKCSIVLTVFEILTGLLPEDDETLRQLWIQAKLPLEGKSLKLLEALENSFNTHKWFDIIFNRTVPRLKKKVESLLKTL